MAAKTTKTVKISPSTNTMMESTSPTVAIILRDLDWRPKADRTIPTLELASPPSQNKAKSAPAFDREAATTNMETKARRLTILRTRPASAKPLLRSGAAVDRAGSGYAAADA